MRVIACINSPRPDMLETVDGIAAFLLKPFFIGLYVGLLLCLLVYIRSKLKSRKMKMEVKQLRQHIQTKLEIEAEDTERKKKEIERLKSECENLRITLQSYYQKPGRAELRLLHIYQKAVEILTEKAPGFAQSWQSAMREGEEEVKKTEKGIVPFIKRLIPGRTGLSTEIEKTAESEN